MKWDATDHVVFDSTGLRVWGSCGAIGIDDSLDVSTGLDASFCPEIPETPTENAKPRDWTPEERRELADHMIGLWSRFRDEAPP